MITVRERFYVLKYQEDGEINYFLVNESGLRLDGFNGNNVESLVEQAIENGIKRSQITCLATREILDRTRERYGGLIEPGNIRFIGNGD